MSNMNLTRSQLAIIGAVIFTALLAVGIFTGVLPGARKNRIKPPEITLNIWGIDEQGLFQENFFAYEALRPNVRVDYEEINPVSYEKDLVDALAAGSGPDIIMFHSAWLPKHKNKILPISDAQLTIKNLQELFPSVVEQNFTASGKIYALPLYVDTLTLFYNQDIFDKKGIALTPKDWLDFQNLIPKLREKDSSGKLAKAAAAIGGSDYNIDKATDLLTLLMLQAGARMTDEDFTQATFTLNSGDSLPGLDSLTFYVKFSDPDDIYYTWNESMGNSLESFAQGKTAMIFNYAAKKNSIKLKNPFLNFKTAGMPQLAGGEKSVNYADYWGLAVTNNSKYPEWAWDLILYLTGDEPTAERYLNTSNRPPALRSLIQKYADHPELGIFAKQALSARSWQQIDKNQIAEIFSQMIKATVSGQMEPAAALDQAEQQITEMMIEKKLKEQKE